MAPTYLNSLSSAFAAAEYHNDHHHDHSIFFSPNNINDDQAAGHAAFSSSSYDLSTHIFFNSSSITTQDDRSVFYRKELQRPHIQRDKADNFDSHGGSYDIENYASTTDNGLKFSIWKKEDKFENYHQSHYESTGTYKATWMTSKMRLMHKMKNDIDPTAVNPPPSATTLIKLENQIKEQVPCSPMEAENSSNTAYSNNSTNPIRVCSDCNTTKTPLWRSGPQGPKSLCNACGIRQRKVRRAMAAAAAAANGTSLETGTTVVLGLKTKTKTEQNEKRSSSTSGGHNVAKYKKRRSKALITSTGPTSSSHDHHQGGINKLCFEDFLLSLTNNLVNFHQVFPQDEKEAAILLMALSCDRAHG